jgi:hypothetical protein
VVWGNNWTAALRCYSCGATFTVEEVAFDKLNGLSMVVPCASCGARPVVTAGGGERSRLHQLVELNEEPEETGAGVRIVVRLKPEWYERLGARACRGSQAEWCLKHCAARGGGEYLLECDDEELAALAALADASRCPEAIRAMREAYLAAIGAA